MYLARAVFPSPEKLDTNLCRLFPLTALTSEARLVFSKSIFAPSGRNRDILNILFMNGIYILYDNRNKIGIKPPDAEL
jgi:hypothetical protein